MLTIAADSVEYLEAVVSTSDNLDPTSDPVEFAFELPSDGNPEAGDWGAGSWKAGGPPYVARALVGAAPFDLADGVYQVWVRITDNPEVPVIPACMLRICGPEGS